ncbi:MAG TPA: hypothetical protein PLC43_04885 [Caldisericia bacterium]|nr:hypothetical protein [Caldisericia bacterium]
MDIETKKQELIKRAQIQKDQFINKLVAEVSELLQQQKEIQQDLEDLEKLVKEQSEKKENK